MSSAEAHVVYEAHGVEYLCNGYKVVDDGGHTMASYIW
jgi:hypothetical protein